MGEMTLEIRIFSLETSGFLCYRIKIKQKATIKKIFHQLSSNWRSYSLNLIEFGPLRESVKLTKSAIFGKM